MRLSCVAIMQMVVAKMTRLRFFSESYLTKPRKPGGNQVGKRPPHPFHRAVPEVYQPEFGEEDLPDVKGESNEQCTCEAQFHAVPVDVEKLEKNGLHNVRRKSHPAEGFQPGKGGAERGTGIKKCHQRHVEDGKCNVLQTIKNSIAEINSAMGKAHIKRFGAYANGSEQNGAATDGDDLF